jgi:hypothetical protein
MKNEPLEIQVIVPDINTFGEATCDACGDLLIRHRSPDIIGLVEESESTNVIARLCYECLRSGQQGVQWRANQHIEDVTRAMEELRHTIQRGQNLIAALERVPLAWPPNEVLQNIREDFPPF